MTHHIHHEVEPLPTLDREGRVRQFLALVNRPCLRDIKIQVVGDSVTLSGCVRSFHEKQLATEFVRRVAGVVGVLNRIDVHYADSADGTRREPWHKSKCGVEEPSQARS